MEIACGVHTSFVLTEKSLYGFGHNSTGTFGDGSK